MAEAQKKVIVRLLTGQTVAGYLPPAGFGASGTVTILDVAAKTIALEMNAIQHIAYVRDFNLDDAADPERIGRREFLGRPRGQGLWVRMMFRDETVLEGLAATDGSLLDALAVDGGLSVTVPDTRSNTLRLFVPRGAIAGFEVLGVVLPGAKKKAAVVAEEKQPGLFDGG